MVTFSATLKHFLEDSKSLTRCQINPIDVNFHLRKSLEIFDENSVDKIWSNKNKDIWGQGDKMSLPMQNRVKEGAFASC